MNAQNGSFDMKEEVATVIAKAAPPITVAGMSLAGVPLQDWVYLLTLVWLIVQIITTCIRFVREGKSNKRKS